jgi:aspartyl-tRNA(Asn)/glutamyl-tRNA(Gln) amidotransferase subunit A
MSWPNISDIVGQACDGVTTARQNVEKSLQIIEEKNPDYNAVVSVCKERALERADYIDSLVKQGKNPGRLAGVTFIAKDNYLVFGSETTASSNMLKGFSAPYQSTAVERLEAEGAICVAKANMDAFAHGGSTENSDFGVTKNPFDSTKVAGGSSGGSAASVALGMVPFALGTDTGGSIRQPASYCGVVGLKPTYGLVSRSGVVAMASSTDVLGPITNNIDDCSIVLDVMSGKDPLDSTSVERDKEAYSILDLGLSGKKIGVISEYFTEGLDSTVRSEVEKTIEILRAKGADIVDIKIPSLPLALAVYYVIVPAELSSNLSRHDGQRYQYSDSTARNLDESYELSRSKGFGAEAKRRIMIGTHVLSSGYYDAYYKKAQTVRTKLINEFNEAFGSVDFLVGPVAPTTAFKIGELVNDPLQMYLMDVMTVAANLVGIPAISIPCGKANGMPVGFQIMTKQKNDRALLAISKSLELELTK